MAEDTRPVSTARQIHRFALSIGVPRVIRSLSTRSAYRACAWHGELMQSLSRYASQGPFCLEVPFGPELTEARARARISRWLASEKTNEDIAKEILMFLVLVASCSRFICGWKVDETVIDLRCLVAEDPNGRKFSFLAPGGWQSSEIIIPQARADPRLDSLRRAWFLEKRTNIPDTNAAEYHLI